MRYMIKTLCLGLVVLGMSGCVHQQEPVAAKSQKVAHQVKSFVLLDEAVIDIANQLQQSNKLGEILPNEIAITAFVDLHQLNKTTRFGRILSESFYNELFIRGFNVLDFRGQNAISVNADGEFFITRDVKKLSKEVRNSYVFVGTYAPFGNGIMINARIIDNTDGKVVASARAIFNGLNCEVFEDCGAPSSKTQQVTKTVAPKMIKITTDNCSTKECPK